MTRLSLRVYKFIIKLDIIKSKSLAFSGSSKEHKLNYHVLIGWIKKRGEHLQ